MQLDSHSIEKGLIKVKLNQSERMRALQGAGVVQAEALRLAGENAARLGGGPYLQSRYSDLLEPKPEETRTPQQVKQQMLKKLRGA